MEILKGFHPRGEMIMVEFRHGDHERFDVVAGDVVILTETEVRHVSVKYPRPDIIQLKGDRRCNDVMLIYFAPTTTEVLGPCPYRGKTKWLKRHRALGIPDWQGWVKGQVIWERP